MPPRYSLPPTRPAPSLSLPLFFVSLAHFTLVRRPSHARHFFASCQPTNQAAKSSSDVAPTDKWSALGLPACGHYWSMRFSVLLPSVFFPSSRPHPSLPTLPPPPSHLQPPLCRPVTPSTRSFSSPFAPPSPSLSRTVSRAFSPSSFTPVFTFYFTSRSFIIFLIS